MYAGFHAGCLCGIIAILGVANINLCSRWHALAVVFEIIMKFSIENYAPNIPKS